MDPLPGGREEAVLRQGICASGDARRGDGNAVLTVGWHLPPALKLDNKRRGRVLQVKKHK